MTGNLLTVNVVTYNHKDHIKKCLDSIMQQKTTFEYVVRIFDDGSDDGTTEICQEYKNKYQDKIEFYPATEHMGYIDGILINCLRSYENIKTPYYLYIEGDDFRMDIDGFQKQIEALEQHPQCAFCMANTINYRNCKYSDIHPDIPTGIYDREFIHKYPERYVFSNLASRIVRTSCINIDSNNPSIYLFDITQFYELMKQGAMYFIRETYACYNITNNGISTSTSLFEKIIKNSKIFEIYNRYSNKEFELNLAIYYMQDLYGYYLWELESLKKTRCEPQSKSERMYNLKKLKHYFIPQAILDLLNLPRDISRKIRALINKEKYSK